VRARVLPAAVVAAALLGAAHGAEATPTCNAPDRLMRWPAAAPVWEFCFRTPVSSTGTDGSGIEISDVFYNGHMVFKRAHVPVLNVLYQTGCGCFRDWSNSEVKFRVLDANGAVINLAGTGNFVETNFPAATVCETGGSGGDVPPTTGFRGVSAETSGNPLVLTTQMTAGWYRYVMRWKFYLDGRIQPWFGYAAVSASCISNSHTHHNYWRLDFDIDGAANDTVQKAPVNSGPSTTKPNTGEMTGFETSSLNRANFNWMVSDTVTGRGYRLVPGTFIPADSFAVSDSWALAYHPGEISDTGGGCATSLNNYLTSEPTDGQDVVLYVRGGQFHQANNLDDCGISQYTLMPVGDWSP
jgi:hypothetical protein